MSRAVAPALIAALAVAALIFTFWPGIDLAVSAAFYDPASGAWAGLAPLPETIRQAIWLASNVAALGLALFTALSLLLGARARVPARVWGFGLLAMALGPGLFVNGVLKAHWGRPRPREVADFGGSLDFVAALDLGGQCVRNCSFVSGEAAGAATLALVIWLLACRRLAGRAARATAAAALAGPAFGAGALRIAGGGHFLSDVVFALLLSALFTIALWRAMAVESLAERLTPGNIQADLRHFLPGRQRRK